MEYIVMFAQEIENSFGINYEFDILLVDKEDYNTRSIFNFYRPNIERYLLNEVKGNSFEYGIDNNSFLKEGKNINKAMVEIFKNRLDEGIHSCYPEDKIIRLYYNIYSSIYNLGSFCIYTDKFSIIKQLMNEGYVNFLDEADMVVKEEYNPNILPKFLRGNTF
jgi:hypothetical protein